MKAIFLLLILSTFFNYTFSVFYMNIIQRRQIDMYHYIAAFLLGGISNVIMTGVLLLFSGICFLKCITTEKTFKQALSE